MSFRNTLNSLLLFTVIFIVGFGIGDVAVLSMFLEGVVLAALCFAVASLFGWLATLLVEVNALSWSSFCSVDPCCQLHSRREDVQLEQTAARKTGDEKDRP